MAIAVAQGNKGRTGSAGSIATGAITTSAGSALVTVFVWDTGTFSSIVDSKSNTWTQIGTELVQGGERARAYYSELSSTGTSHTVTAAQNSTSAMTIFVAEVSGGTIPGITDKDAQATDATSPYTSGATAATTQAIELLLGLYIGNSGSNPATHAIDSTSTPTSGWSIVAAAEETNGASFYTGGIANQRVTSTSTYACAWTESGSSGTHLIRTATFKEAAAGGTVIRLFFPYGMDGLGGGVVGGNRIK